MSRYSILLIVFFILTSCGSQYKEKLFYKNMSCVKQDKLTVTERNKIYPYNISEKIVLATYHQQKPGVAGGEMWSYFVSMEEDKSLFDKLRFEDYVELNSSQKDELTNLIFNYGYLKDSNVRMSSGCYMPNNAILFLDKDDNLLEYIEICFDCNAFRSSNKEIDLGDECMQKMDLLNEFFLKSGIKKTRMLR